MSWQDYLAVADSVPGWFPEVDRDHFVRLLQDPSVAGDVLEIGVFQGQSAILLGFFTERLIACDVFDEVITGDANAAENVLSYEDLSKERFLVQWRRFHSESALDLRVCLSSDLDLPESSLRFLHLDGSHLYDVVTGDIAMAHRLLAPGGVLVLDDYRSPHTPGVAAATWQAVHEGLLLPFRLTPQKMYAAVDAAGAARGRALLDGSVPPGLGLIVESVDGIEFDVLYPVPAAEPDPELPREVVARAGREVATAVREGVGGLASRISRGRGGPAAR